METIANKVKLPIDGVWHPMSEKPDIESGSGRTCFVFTERYVANRSCYECFWNKDEHPDKPWFPLDEHFHFAENEVVCWAYTEDIMPQRID